MTGMKGRILKKLGFITTKKQGLALQLQYPHDNDLDDHEGTDLEFRNIKGEKTRPNLKSSSSSDTESLSEFESNDGDDDDDLPFLDALTEPEPETEPETSMEQYKCPPGGSGCVIFYTTSFRGIRKTFEDCNTIRFLLESVGVKFHERDVSMDLELREELWRVMGGRVIPPRLFIKGRHIGGADEVVTLHEQGKLRELLDGLPLYLPKGPCKGCGNLRFVVCPNCHGSCKVVEEEDSHGLNSTRCHECNENGLVKCPICL